MQVTLRGYCPVKDGGNGQSDQLSLMPLSVAGRGRLQLGVGNLATSVVLLQVVDNIDPLSVVVIFLWGTPQFKRPHILL